MRRERRLSPAVQRAGLLLAIAYALWIPFEDTNEIAVIFFAAATCALLGFWFTAKQSREGPLRWRIILLTGLGSGLALTPIAIALMAIKTGLHGHGVPDFSPAQIERVILLTPVWIAAGGLIATGAGLWYNQRHPS